MGTGGAPEGVLAAAALKCMGGNFMGKLEFRNDEEIERAKAMGFGETNRLLTIDDLIKGEHVMFCATGITDGDLTRGVRFFGNNARTHSVVMHSDGTVRFIESVHRLGARPHAR
jgi:fructose-1,6-bisphosphatase II